MDTLRQTASLSPAEAASLRRAFGADRSRDGDGERTIAIEDQAIVLRSPDGERRMPTPGKGGAPQRPSVAADGSRAAWIRDGAVEIVKVSTGFAGRLRQLASWHAVTPMKPARAVDVSEDGSKVAYVSQDRLYVDPAEGGGHGAFFDLPGPEGLEAGATDVECLPGGRAAVETQFGTYLLVDAQGQASALPLASFDPEAAAARREQAARALPALQPAELDGLLETFGSGLVGAEASPEGSRVALQVRTQPGQVANYLLDRASGRRTPLGMGPGGGAAWSPDGSFLALDLEAGGLVLRGTERSRPLPGPAAGAAWAADGRSLTLADGRQVRLDEVFDSWTLDMGTGLLAGPTGQARVVVEEDVVQIGSVRLPLAGR